MKDVLRQLAGDSVVYGLGGALAKGISFLMLPVYTRIFSPYEYGLIELFTVMGLLLESVLGMGMDSAQSYFFLREKPHGELAQARVVSAILQWRMTWGIILLCLILAAAHHFQSLFLTGSLETKIFIFFGAGTWLAMSKSQSADVFRLNFEPRSFVLLHVVNSLLFSGLTILFVLVFKLGFLSFVLGYFISNLLSAGQGLAMIRRYLSFRQLNRDWWPRLLKFGGPLVPASVGLYYLSFSDRWLISYYLTPNDLAQYAAGAKFALVVGLGVGTFRQAWWPIAMDLIHQSRGPEVLKVVSRYYLGLGAIAAILMSVLAGPLLRLLVPESYFQARPLVGILVWSSILYGYFMVIGMGIWKREKTYLTTVNLLIAALVSVLGQLLLIPRLGLLGAAIPTVVSFLVWNILTLWCSERLWPVGYSLGTMALQLALGTMGSGVLIWMIEISLVNPLVIALMTLLLVILLVTTMVDQRDISLCKDSLQFRFLRRSV